MESVDIQPHIRLGKANAAPVAVIVGDPARAQHFAEMCDSHKELAYNREYRSFEVVHDGERFLVLSHGVGSAGAGICFEELIQIGVKVLIRAGTAGSLQPDSITTGSLMNIHAAVREDGLSQLLVPFGYPAACSYDIYNEIQMQSTQRNVKMHEGITLTSDLFYKSKVLPSSLEMYHKARVDTVEMEVAPLFVIARMAGVKAAALCVVDGSPFGWATGCYDPTGKAVSESKKKMADIVLNAAAQVIKKKLY